MQNLLISATCFSVLTLWFSARRQIWGTFFIFFILMAYAAERLSILGLLWIAILLFAAEILHRKPALGWRIFAYSTIVGICVAGMLHKLPGFYNIKIFENISLRADAIPYTMYLNFDKAAIGIILLGYFHNRVTGWKHWWDLYKSIFAPFFYTFLAVAFCSITLKFVRFEPIAIDVLLQYALWIPINLLIVCMTEEVVFRGGVQRVLAQYMPAAFAIVLTATGFGLLHYMGGVSYILLSTVAGIGYGWAYAKTHRIEASILVHFGVNCVHFLFFTYPALA